MTEANFVRNNEAHWRRIESLLSDTNRPTPHEISDAFVLLTDDLAFARTHFPSSKITMYLNELSGRVHASLLGTKRESLGRIKTFWAYDVPLAMYSIRGFIALSALCLIVITVVTYVASLTDDSIARMILGDFYVAETISNIESGDPMGIYKQDAEWMFLKISFNNCWVMIKSISMGVIPVVGFVYIILQHGVMLGAFHGLFAVHNEIKQMLLTVYIHGALELSLLVVSAAAGLAIGMSFIHPGTYARKESFIRAVRNAAKVAAGLIPLIIVAAFLESFVTRHTEMPVAFSLIIIFSTLGGFWWYALWHPRRLLSRGLHG